MNRLFKVTENEKIIPDHSTVFTALGASSFGMLDRQELEKRLCRRNYLTLV